MQWLAEVCIRRPVLTTMLIVAIAVFGLVGYGALGVDRFPNVDFPVVTVIIASPGASAVEIERDITEKSSQPSMPSAASRKSAPLQLKAFRRSTSSFRSTRTSTWQSRKSATSSNLSSPNCPKPLSRLRFRSLKPMPRRSSGWPCPLPIRWLKRHV